MINWYNVQSTIVEYLPKVIIAAVVLVLGIYLGGLLRKSTIRMLGRTGADAGVSYLLGQIVYWSMLGLSILFAVSRFANITALLAGLGLVGFALTFALQDVLRNFMAGIILLVQRPFIVGDYVQLMSYEGTVKSIHSRTTEMLTGDGLTVMLPNASVIDNPIVNYSRTPQRRLEVNLTLPYDADLQRVRELVVKVVKQVPAFLAEPAPDVLFENATGGVTLKVRLWVDTLRAPAVSSKDQALHLIYHALKAEGIEFRYPRQEISVFMEQPAESGSVSPGPQ
jgi:small conductance mechanosensitive channel